MREILIGVIGVIGVTKSKYGYFKRWKVVFVSFFDVFLASSGSSFRTYFNAKLGSI